RATVEGASGPEGRYINTPLLAQAGAIVGDTDRSVTFRRASSEYIRVEVEAGDFTTDEITMEAWVKPATLTSGVGNRNVVMAGPQNTTLSEPVAMLYLTNAGVTFRVPDGLGATDAVGSALPTGQWSHVVGTKDAAGNIVLYVNGAQVATGNTAGAVTPNSTLRFYVGSSDLNFANNAFD